ncbi:MAG TPA: carbamoyl-phosphate synthase domain-containing protein, partial [Ilumatobacteraceae bacterium]
MAGQQPIREAALVLADGSVFEGEAIGAQTPTGVSSGEVVFNTVLSGYQEVLTDPSYAGQIITFTFPHVGNVGVNPDDLESTTPAARGCILRDDVTDPSNYRAKQHLDGWLRSNNLIGITGIDTRRLVRLIR